MSPKLWIGMLVFLVLAQVVCNWVENNDMFTPENVAEIQAIAEHSQTTSVATTGESVSFLDKTWSFISQYVFFDYTVFKTYDPDTGEITDNWLAIFRYILICIGIVMLVEAFIIGRRMLPF